MTPSASFLVLGTLLSAACGASVPQWRWLSPAPTGNHLIHVFSIDSLRGFLVANNGEVAETKDAGITWNTIGAGNTSLRITAATSLDGRTLLGAGYDGKLWKTTDSGQAWRPAALNDGTFFGICQIDSATAVAAGQGGMIYRSSDAGDSWTQVSEDSLGRNLYSIACDDRGIAMAVGFNGLILKSSDGGKTWKDMALQDSLRLTAVKMRDSQWVYAASAEGVFLESKNGGITWKKHIIDSTILLRGIAFREEDITLTGSDGAIWQSADGGETWSLDSTDLFANLASVANFGEKKQVVVGDNGTILCRDDKSQPWRQHRLGSVQHVIGITALSDKSWMAFGIAGLAMQTSDAGKTWKERQLEKPYGLLAGDFWGDQRGLLVGHEGTVLRTLDGGESWHSVESGITEYWLDGVAWADSQTAVVVGEQGILLRTQDAGQTWKAVVVPDLGDRTMSAVTFTSPKVGVIVGYQGLILKTTDGGASWSPRSTGVLKNLFSVSFLNSQVGMAVGQSGTVVTTQDGGETWKAGSTGFPNDHLYGGLLIGNDTAMVVGDWGHRPIARYTTDGGKSWLDMPAVSPWVLTGLMKVGEGRVVATGDRGMVLIADFHGLEPEVQAPPVLDMLPTLFRANRQEGNSIRLQLTLPYAGQARIIAYSPAGHWLGRIFDGPLTSGTNTLIAPLALPGPMLFRMSLRGSGGLVLNASCRLE